MDNRSFYNEILTEHNLRPANKREIDDATVTLEGINPSCGDDIILSLKVENDTIVDGGFTGDGCAISQASADMMLDLIMGRSKDEALRLGDIFMRMIRGEVDESELDELEESQALKDIAHMPARVKCAVLGWHTMEEMLKVSGVDDSGSVTTENM